MTAADAPIERGLARRIRDNALRDCGARPHLPHQDS